MPYYWLNTFNMIEVDGPFETVDAAKADAEKVYTEIQDGLALSIAIVESERQNKPTLQDRDRFGDNVHLLKTGTLVAEGHIENGRWAEA